MPLHYSLQALSTAANLGSRQDEVNRALQEIKEFLLGTAGKQETDPLFSSIEHVHVRNKGSGWRRVPTRW